MGQPCRKSSSNEWNNTSHSQNAGNFANLHPFPGHEFIMPDFDPNHLAFPNSPQKEKKLPGFDPNNSITAPEV
eukprot:3267812-Pleurochrysis_carterae.AAC.2